MRITIQTSPSSIFPERMPHTLCNGRKDILHHGSICRFKIGRRRHTWLQFHMLHLLQRLLIYPHVGRVIQTSCLLLFYSIPSHVNNLTFDHGGGALVIGVQLHFRRLPWMYRIDIRVSDFDLDHQVIRHRNDIHDRLAGRHYPAYRRDLQ